MALPHYQYRDPCDVLERKQNAALKKTCYGCIYEFKMAFQSSVVMGCDKNKKHGRKCELYKVGV